MKKIIYYILLFFIISVIKTTAQEIRVDTLRINKTRTIKRVSVLSVPKFILQISANYNFGALELTGHNGGFSRDDLLNGKNFGARNGYGFSITGKIPLSKKGLFWVDGILSYNRFQSNLIANNTEEGKSSYNVFSGGFGAEYNFTSYHSIKLFIGVNTLFSSINGKATLIFPDNTTYDVKFNPSFRIGYSIFSGFDYALNKNVGFNMSIKFTHANLLLKSSTDNIDFDEADLNDYPLMSLNTTKYLLPDRNAFYSGWKQFAYISVSAGLSYYFGVKQKRYKLP